MIGKCPQAPPPAPDMEIELSKLSSPRIFLVRMLVFLVLCGLVAVVPTSRSFSRSSPIPHNAPPDWRRATHRHHPVVPPGDPALSGSPGSLISASPIPGRDRAPAEAAGALMAAILGGERTGRMTISQQTMRHLLI